MSLKLFEDSWEEGGQEQDDTSITNTILYFSTEELSEFKKLCKVCIEKMYKNDKFENGNIPDLLLNLLKEYNENN